MAPHRDLRPLDLLCACLSAGQRGRRLDTATAAALINPATDLVSFAQLAGRHLVTPMLAACIADPEIGPLLPEDFRTYLEFMHAQNSSRNETLRLQLAEAAARLNEVGIQPVLLKGAIRLVDGLYPDPGWRFMRDLDLLIPRDRLPEAVACLSSLGYGFQENVAEWSTQYKHLPPLRRDGDAAVIEIHSEPLSSRHGLCGAEGVQARSTLVDLDGTQVRIPDIVDQLAQLIGHDRFDRYLSRSRMFLLRSIFETALLCRNQDHTRQLLDRFASEGVRRWAWTQLGLAARLFPDYVARPRDGGLIDNLETRALLGLEQLDENGRLRRLVWFGWTRIDKLFRLREEREHLAANIWSTGYHRRGVRRLRRLWKHD
ncbi:nucleotidyltransferase family protein [Nordella sp. HKS 07]|uniref:nucleotidyltransferase family protein n=1 Tax=Nordella sp. HKS 07 TaxID=2712222 RepID=UPI0013E10F08|nr:nucleotidyltransferase family protein [Nordella sp. HKS 07]QIG51073.1 nucleotidyltransferase family protein [Nordella sp. HKS 07]